MTLTPHLFTAPRFPVEYTTPARGEYTGDPPEPLVLEDLHKPPSLKGLLWSSDPGVFRFTWPTQLNAKCYSVYWSLTNDPSTYVKIVNCITDLFYDATACGYYQVTYTTEIGESSFGTPLYVGGCEEPPPPPPPPPGELHFSIWKSTEGPWVKILDDLTMEACLAFETPFGEAGCWKRMYHIPPAAEVDWGDVWCQSITTGMSISIDAASPMAARIGGTYSFFPTVRPAIGSFNSRTTFTWSVSFPDGVERADHMPIDWPLGYTFSPSRGGFYAPTAITVPEGFTDDDTWSAWLRVQVKSHETPKDNRWAWRSFQMEVLPRVKITCTEDVPNTTPVSPLALTGKATTGQAYTFSPGYGHQYGTLTWEMLSIIWYPTSGTAVEWPTEWTFSTATGALTGTPLVAGELHFQMRLTDAATAPEAEIYADASTSTARAFILTVEAPPVETIRTTRLRLVSNLTNRIEGCEAEFVALDRSKLLHRHWPVTAATNTFSSTLVGTETEKMVAIAVPNLANPTEWRVSISTDKNSGDFSHGQGSAIYAGPLGTATWVAPDPPDEDCFAIVGTAVITDASLYLTEVPEGLPRGTVGVPYSYQVQHVIVDAEFAESPVAFTWAWPGGVNDSGLTFDGGGLISGTPTNAGSYSFIVTGVNNESDSRSEDRVTFTIVIDPAP